MTEFIITPEAQEPRAQALKLIEVLSPRQKWVVTVKRYVKKRTNGQNSLMWSWVEKAAKAAGDVDGCSKLMMHERFKRMFLTPVETFEADGVVYAIYSTTKLSTTEMSEYMEHISQYCAEEYGVDVQPVEFYR